MTILPKKKEGRKGDEHEGESRNRTRNIRGTNWDTRSIPHNNRSTLQQQQDNFSEGNNTHSPNQQRYNELDCLLDTEDPSSCLPLKRVRHNNRQACSSSKSPRNTIDKHGHLKEQENLNEDENIDGYNSGDEYGTCGEEDSNTKKVSQAFLHFSFFLWLFWQCN
jgi:hypothetical protein